MTKRLNFWLLALLVIVGLPYYWLLIDDPAGGAKAKPVSIWQLREAAAGLPGERPVTIRYDTASARRVPRIILAAGQGIKLIPVSMRSYSITFPSQPPIIVDGGITLVQASGFRFRSFETATLERMNALRGKARLVTTLGAATARTPVPKGSAAEAATASSRDASACSKPRAIAPGLVEIPVCEKVLAKRLIYVRLADGKEFLLTGDIAPTLTNVEQLAGPSRLMNDYFATQDRTAIHSWLLTIRRLSAQAPDMTDEVDGSRSRHLGAKV